MVIEFAPKPQPISTVDKAVSPKKSVDADHSDKAQAPKPARPKTGATVKEAVEKNGELF
jgi:hypothetical protein